MRKSIIHQFDPIIYPSLLWIAVGVSTSDLNGTFCIYQVKTGKFKE